MKTKAQIKAKGLQLFNKAGIAATTLRHVAAALDKSYGNITYHYNTKSTLLIALYQDWLLTQNSINQQLSIQDNLFKAILLAPKQTFDLSLEYLCFFKDYSIIRQQYPDLSALIDQDNEARKSMLYHLLAQLQIEGWLLQTLRKTDLYYLMELSGAMRTFFFLQLAPKDYGAAQLKERYCLYINKLLWPYLSPKGQEVYLDIYPHQDL